MNLRAELKIARAEVKSWKAMANYQKNRADALNGGIGRIAEVVGKRSDAKKRLKEVRAIVRATLEQAMEG